MQYSGGTGTSSCLVPKTTTDNNTGRDPYNQNSSRSGREKWSISKGGPVISKLFPLDQTDPLSFGFGWMDRAHGIRGTFLDYGGLLAAIPKDWKNAILHGNQEHTNEPKVT